MDVTLDIPRETMERLERRVAESEFESVEAYLGFVVKEVVTPRSEIESVDSEDRESEVRDQLESLGYIE
jgi:CBS domain containing-hemolysin-like protein